MTDAATSAPEFEVVDEEQFSARPGDGALARSAHRRDTTVGRWGPTSPSATQIGRARSPEGDVSENLRRLHDERHPATEGHGARQHRLEKLRITQALCNDLDVTPWQRDRALGVMIDLDLTAFGSQRAIEKVALVTIRHVVDDERERYLGLQDQEWLADQSPERLEALYEQFTSITDDPHFQDLAAKHGLEITNLNRLRRVLRDQLDEQDLHGAVYGRNPYRDPNLPSSDLRESEQRGSDDGRDREETSGER
ncbi:DNA-directed RNA polymerase subunit epsilon [Halarchaeum sp. CBA1220]|uniref:DNA-directed RNA polymerase subunit epsilon n=1 Tax=Halarchaeum sp. CBA1220 TaxID=1853682 RepID=UPI002107456C|nr:DNA-directed RNA polymerase subunit epsilon [Halarchaeum sp. CBA1220]